MENLNDKIRKQMEENKNQRKEIRDALKSRTLLHTAIDYMDCIGELSGISDLLNINYNEIENPIEFIKNNVKEILIFTVLQNFFAENEAYEYAGRAQAEIRETKNNFRNFLLYNLSDHNELPGVLDYHYQEVIRISKEINYEQFIEENL